MNRSGARRKVRRRGRLCVQKNDSMEMINPNAAGIDVGSEEHWVAVPADRDEQPVRSFGCFTADLYALADWLEQCGIETVAMESTSVYWIALFQVLETRGFEVKWLMPDTSRMCQGERAMFWTANGSSGCIAMVFYPVPFVLKIRSVFCAVTGDIVTVLSVTHLLIFSTCRKRSSR